MKQFEREGSVYRFNGVSRIRQTWLRRFLLISLFLPMLVINWIFAAVSVSIALPVFVIRGAIKNTITLTKSIALRWNVRKED